jgi:hypothetical protein
MLITLCLNLDTSPDQNQQEPKQNQPQVQKTGSLKNRSTNTIKKKNSILLKRDWKRLL